MKNYLNALLEGLNLVFLSYTSDVRNARVLLNQ